MEFETVDYTDEMVIVKNNGKGTTANRKLTTHSYIMYIYIFIGKYIYIYIYVYKYNTIILHGNSDHFACFVYCNHT